jgi:hypothetical protein
MTEHLNASQARFVLFREGKPLLKVSEDAEGKEEEGKKDVKYDGLYFAEFREIGKFVGDRSFR